MRRLALLAALAALAGCGDDGGAAAGRPQLTVSAASSLKAAFTDYGERFAAADARFSFAGSDELAAQIRQGVKPDVYAAANTTLPEELHADGLVEKPVVFARNRLVLAVPDGSDVGSLEDVEAPGTTLAVGSASVPIGSYTRTVLGKLPPARRRAILANVRSEEPDVAGIVGKLAQGAVDAGFVYASDVRGAALTAIRLPDALQPEVAYGAAIVKDARHPEQARAFVDGLLEGDGRRALLDAGFEPPPG
jgi:molybdate transport system substrate-binding protein